MYKLIKLANGRYFAGFEENGMIKSVVQPLDAKRFVIKPEWHQETELMEIQDKLDDRVEYKIYILSYTVDEY